MSEQENERTVPASDDPDVEGHRVVPRSDEADESEAPGRRENDESAAFRLRLPRVPNVLGTS